MPPTIGDRIAAKKKADADLKPSRDAVTTAGSAYAAAMAAAEAANASLRIDLKASGPVYIRDTNGLEVFVADESEAGFRSFSPADAATIPASEAPPAPGPEPTPTPGPEPTPAEPVPTPAPAPAAGPTVEPAPAAAQWNETPKPEPPPA